MQVQTHRKLTKPRRSFTYKKKTVAGMTQTRSGDPMFVGVCTIFPITTTTTTCGRRFFLPLSLAHPAIIREYVV
jgi:hypothetical protein